MLSFDQGCVSKDQWWHISGESELYTSSTCQEGSSWLLIWKRCNCCPSVCWECPWNLGGRLWINRWSLWSHWRGFAWDGRRQVRKGNKVHTISISYLEDKDLFVKITNLNPYFLHQGGVWADLETTAARLGLQVLEHFFLTRSRVKKLNHPYLCYNFEMQVI